MKRTDLKADKHEDIIVKTNISLPKSFHKKIKQRALDEDITVNALALKALKEYIEK